MIPDTQTDDIAELFQRDPLKLTDKNLDLIISKFRQARKQFNLGAVTAGKAPKPLTEKQKQTVSLVEALNIKLDL